MTRVPWEHPVRAVLASVRYAGMGWRVDAGRLFVTGPTDRLTDEHRAAIGRNRAELVTILEALPPRCSVPHMCGVIGPCQRCRPAASEGGEAA